MRRRDFMAATAVALPAFAFQRRRKRIAALCTTYFLRSHADDIITRFLEGYWINERFYLPPCEVVSLYMDQVHPADIGYRLSTAYGFPVKSSIADALTLSTGRLAVDGVLLVGEHGDYPFNDKQQQLYPRYEFHQQVVEVFRQSSRSVPVYSDKHFSYDWNKAKQIYDWSGELHYPLMAGSSVSVTFRRPELDFPLSVEFEDALMVGGSWVTDGGIFHNLETLQCFVERRKGGETGVRAVTYVVGDAVWKAAEEGRWSKELMHAALARADKLGPGRPEDVKQPVVCLIEYNDGFHAATLSLGGLVNEYVLAFRVKGRGQIDSTNCYDPVENSNNFSPLVHAIAHMYLTGQHLYPVERTLLTTGALSFMLNGKHRDFNVDAKGNLVVVEEQTTIDAIPAAAKAAILKKVGAGKLRTVETFQKPGAELMYEAGYTTKTGRHAEVLVKADGTETKE